MDSVYGFGLFPMLTYRPAEIGQWRVTAHLPSLGPGYVSPAGFGANHVLTHGGQVWMSTGLMERESHAWHVHCANGTVVAAGLGLGMYVFAVAMKADVDRVVAAELSPDVVRLMKEAARFDDWPCRDKVEIIEVDAQAHGFADRVLAATGGGRPDYLYADIWPDLSAPDAPAASAAMAHALGAKSAGWWGQELAFGRWCGEKSRPPDESALRDYVAEIGVPVPVTEGYASFCRDVVTIHDLSPRRRAPRLWRW